LNLANAISAKYEIRVAEFNSQFVSPLPCEDDGTPTPTPATVVIRNFMFPIENLNLHVKEELSESIYAFRVPALLLPLYLEVHKRLLQTLTTRYALFLKIKSTQVY
jgi:hypothetical protein